MALARTICSAGGSTRRTSVCLMKEDALAPSRAQGSGRFLCNYGHCFFFARVLPRCCDGGRRIRGIDVMLRVWCCLLALARAHDCATVAHVKYSSSKIELLCVFFMSEWEVTFGREESKKLLIVVDQVYFLRQQALN